MMGHARVLRPLVPARLRGGLPRRPGRVEFVRVRLARDAHGLVATSAGDQATGMLKTLLRADGLAVVPADRGAIEPDGAVDVQVLRGELLPWEA
jgi:molybdopterin molybdotransferase